MIRLGDAWISLERREAFLNGAPVRLGSRAFDVLEALLAAPNRLVTKAELLQAAWPDLVVEENNLQVQVSALRKHLGLDVRLLETVPRRGYRLNLQATVVAAAEPPARPVPAAPVGRADVHVIDDEPAVRTALVRQLRSAGIEATAYASAPEFLARCPCDRPGCLLLDVRLREGSGFDLQDELARRGVPLSVVFMSGFGTIDMSVKAMKAGAEGFLTKPVDEAQLLAAVGEAMGRACILHQQRHARQAVQARYASLTPRERDVFRLLLEGRQNRDIAQQLGLQDVTVKMHKKHVMTKLGASNLIHLLVAGRTLGMLPQFDPVAEPA
ncbi:response regulator [Metapseudomonas otitidis]|jgi:FixJ family two-component response regulator|uniref:response regulator n=1 Tax=Metapseudomonas otitidis TaxID=319939 RepID=UPI00227D1374|nr:response regulator [Pseudomonas otitidis]WAF88251.1 response regulator [Pseudomonas otitidis]